MRSKFFPIYNREPREAKQGNVILRFVFQKGNRVYRLLLRNRNIIIGRWRSSVNKASQISSSRTVLLTKSNAVPPTHTPTRIHTHKRTFGNIRRHLWLHIFQEWKGAFDIQWVEVRDAAKHSPMHRTAPKIPIVPRWRNPVLKDDAVARRCNVAQPTMDSPERQRKHQEIMGHLKFVFCHEPQAG